MIADPVDRPGVAIIAGVIGTVLRPIPAIAIR